MEEVKKTRGGARPGAGRKPSGITTTQLGLKIDNDLFDVFKAHKDDIKMNRYINDAIRAKMIADGYLEEE